LFTESQSWHDIRSRDLAGHSSPSFAIEKQEVMVHTKGQDGIDGLDDAGWKEQNKAVTLIKAVT
jgi:hypothetical protein